MLNYTNCTISLLALLLWESTRPLSPSSSCMLVKSALPTPMMMMERGRDEAETIKSLVWDISWISPSVMMSKV